MLSRLIQNLRLARRRRVYRVGATVCRFVARDVRRDVEVIDISELEHGFITARIRTWNVLYDDYGFEAKPGFGAVQRVSIETLWDWSGELWGGPIPNDDPGNRH